MQFPNAVRWFNDTFNLGMDIDSPADRKAVKQAENAQRKRARERELREWTERMQFNLALTADMIVQRMEEVRDTRRPRTYSEQWDEEFCAAVESLPEARRFADDCMMYCMKENRGE